MTTKKAKGGIFSGGGDFGLGGLFGGLGELVDKLSELAEKGEELSKTGEFEGLDLKKGLKGVYGFSVKVGPGKEGQDEVKVEPFGNIRKDESTGESIVAEVREPMIDIFEENDHVLVVAEMPGIGEGDVTLDLKEDVLTIKAEKNSKKFFKEVLLSESFDEKKMTSTYNNGVMEIKFTR